ncbi:MAG: factor-independent urate hydroxylase, partial [Tepidisphaeraceae bacterium]
MPVLKENSYGKSCVRLTKVVRHGAHHDLMEMSVDISLGGDFAASYESGDNSKVIATDSMKNTVYVLAKERSFASIEEFAVQLARHFVQTYEQVQQAAISISQTAWARLGNHPHAFIDGGAERRICRAVLTGDKLELTGGVADLRFLKTTGSEFSGFVTDRYRTLPDAADRIFATSVEAVWAYKSESVDFNGTFTAARAALIQTMADHHSLAVQQTLLEMGNAVLKVCP